MSLAIEQINRRDITLDETIKRIRTALQKRSGKAWSVTRHKGSLWGWITIEAPPARRTGHWVQRPGTVGNPGDYDYCDTGEPNGNTAPAELKELAELMGLESVHFQGVSIAAETDFWLEYVDRAEGRTPEKIAKPYWD